MNRIEFELELEVELKGKGKGIENRPALEDEIPKLQTPQKISSPISEFQVLLLKGDFLTVLENRGRK